MKSYITVKATQNYGRTAIYPVCDTAKSFAKLAGTTTLTSASIMIIKNMGYSIQIKQDLEVLA